jgi:hypothetical protein
LAAGLDATVNGEGLDGATGVELNHAATGPVHNSPTSKDREGSAEEDVTRAITVLKDGAADFVARRWDSQAVLTATGIAVRPVLVTPALVGRVVSTVARVSVVQKDLAGHAGSGHADSMVSQVGIAALARAHSSLALKSAVRAARIGMVEGPVPMARWTSAAGWALAGQWIAAVRWDRAAIADLIASAGRRGADLMVADSPVHAVSRAIRKGLIAMTWIANRGVETSMVSPDRTVALMKTKAPAIGRASTAGRIAISTIAGQKSIAFDPRPGIVTDRSNRLWPSDRLMYTDRRWRVGPMRSSHLTG